MELLIPYGLLQEALVHVDEVRTGANCGCSCLNCHAPLVAKNAGRTRRHHFAHTQKSQSCGGERWLHATAKLLLAERIKRGLGDGHSIPISYKCSICRCPHDGDLLKGVEGVQVETSIPEAGIRPDIRMEGRWGKLVEIVHTHEPEQPVLDFVRTSGVTLVQLSVVSVDDLEDIKGGTLTPHIRTQHMPLQDRSAQQEDGERAL